MPARPFLPQHPDYHPGRRLPWWSRPSGAIGHTAWFRALAEVEACSPDRGNSPTPTIWRVYADIVSPPVVRYALDLAPDATEDERSAAILQTLRAHGNRDALATLEASFIGRDDAGRFTRTQDPA